VGTPRLPTVGDRRAGDSETDRPDDDGFILVQRRNKSAKCAAVSWRMGGGQEASKKRIAIVSGSLSSNHPVSNDVV
jgi:hypothetical protein